MGNGSKVTTLWNTHDVAMTRIKEAVACEIAVAHMLRKRAWNIQGPTALRRQKRIPN